MMPSPVTTPSVYLPKHLLDHRVQEQDGGLTNYTKRSDTIRVARATSLTTPIYI